MNRKKRRDVVVVGMKLTPGGRELLTWTLAKFTQPGDEVLALHIAAKQQVSSQSSIHPKAYAVASKLTMDVENIFDSVAGVYKGYCTAKNVKLQLKVISSGLSVRRTLVEEVKHYNAMRLILGAQGPQVATKNFSLALATYCYTHLPCTCSTVVIRHGLVVLEKAGALRLAGDSIRDVHMMIDKISGQWIFNKARREPKVEQHDTCGKPRCLESSFDRKLDVSDHIGHPYKYVPVHVQGLRTCILELERLSTMVAISGSRGKYSISRSLSRSRNECHPKMCCSTDETEGHYDQKKKSGEVCFSFDSVQGIQKAANRSACNKWGWPLVKTDWNYAEPFPSKLSLGLETPNYSCKSSNVGIDLIQKVTADQNRHTTSEITQGWPLLNRPITGSKSDGVHLRARNMSVLEWALQLPDRSKGYLEQISSSRKTSVGSAATNEENCTEACHQEAQPDAAVLDFDSEIGNSLPRKCGQLCKDNNLVAFHLAVLEKSTNNFSKDNIIGKGGCSRVYCGVLSDAHIVAIKRFDKFASSSSENEFLTELAIVSSLHHRNIIQLLGYCIDDQQHHCLVYNFATEGNLEQKLHQDNKAVLPWSVRYKVALGIGEALEYLHNSAEPPVIHRDVKSSNILLQSDFIPQLADFGLSRLASTSSMFLTCSDVVGTFGYLAPEYFMFGKVSDKTDVYSFGVVLLELVSGKHPVKNVGSNGNESLISWAKKLKVDESIKAEVVDIRLGNAYDSDQLRHVLSAASLCLQHSPNMRPPMSKILKVLRGEHVDLESGQDSMSVDGFCAPWQDDYDIHNHLTMALYGVDNDSSSEAGMDKTVCSAKTNKLIEEYLQGRCSRSSSFD